MADEKTSVTYEKGRLYSLRIADISPNPNQPRKYFDQEMLDRRLHRDRQARQQPGMMQQPFVNVKLSGALTKAPG
jgi:hypothetical protein